MKIGRNDPCHCGSSKKYKKCCLDNDKILSKTTYSDMQKIAVLNTQNGQFPIDFDEEHYELKNIQKAIKIMGKPKRIVRTSEKGLHLIYDGIIVPTECPGCQYVENTGFYSISYRFGRESSIPANLQ